MQSDNTIDVQTPKSPTNSLAEAAFHFLVITDKLSVFEHHYRELRAMEKELDDFLVTYYAKILPLCQQLKQLRSPLDPEIPPFLKPRCPLEHSIRQLYTRVLKTSHPDNPIAGKRNSLAIEVIAAYEKRNVATLWKFHIEYECRFHHKGHIADYLEAEMLEVDMMQRLVRIRRLAILANPAWRLKERVIQAGLNNIDLMHQIEEELRRKIADIRKDVGCENPLNPLKMTA